MLDPLFSSNPRIFSFHCFEAPDTAVVFDEAKRAAVSAISALVSFPVLSYSEAMFIVHVHVRVIAEDVEPFKAATIRNASLSLLEPGVLRFDVVQQQDDPTRFVLVEVYQDADAAAAHKESAHYPVWRDAVAPMMAEPRASVKYDPVFPDEQGWRNAPR